MTASVVEKAEGEGDWEGMRQWASQNQVAWGLADRGKDTGYCSVCSSVTHI